MSTTDPGPVSVAAALLPRSPDPGCLHGLAWLYPLPDAISPDRVIAGLQARAPVPGRRLDERLGDTEQLRLVLPYRCEVRVRPGTVQLIHRVSADEVVRRDSEAWLETVLAAVGAELSDVHAHQKIEDVEQRGPAPPGEPVYLDCNASTPPCPEAVAAITEALIHPGNAGPDHWHGRRAAQRVADARAQVAALVGRGAEAVIWTSGATEANNLALLGVATGSIREGRHRPHLVSTAIEHPSVLGPLRELAARGADVTLVPPGSGGRVSVDDLLAAVRPHTTLVSIMSANNVTGVRQPIEEVAAGLAGHPAVLHVDAAQSYGKELVGALPERIDLLTVSSHKIYGPLGVGALLLGPRLSPEHLAPLLFGGRQERGLRPGTESVPLLAGFAAAAEAAAARARQRAAAAAALRQRLLAVLDPLGPLLLGDQDHCQPHVLCLAVPGLEAAQFQAAVAPWISVGTGAACTPGVSPALRAMGVDDQTALSAVRLSWWEGSAEPDLDAVIAALRQAMGAA